MTYSAVILAGGQSRRMGRDKAFLQVDGGQSLLARQIEIIRHAGAAEIYISGRADTDYSAFGCRVLPDRYPDVGPLAGIEAALNAATHPLLLVLAVDLPRMSASCLRRLLAGCTEERGGIPCLHGQAEPLAAVYPRATQVLAAAQIRAGENAVRAFAEQCVEAGLARWEEFSADAAPCFDNWNNPCDLAQLAPATKPA